MKLKFYPHPKKTETVWANKLEQVFNQVDTKWKNKLVPIISFEMNILNEKFPNIPIHVFHHSVAMDKIVCQVENDKYNLVEMIGKLGKIEDFDAKVFKTAFLTTEFNPEFEIEGIYFYDNQGYLIKEINKYLSYIYEWTESKFGKFLKSKTEFTNDLNLARTKYEYDYDENGFCLGYNAYNCERSFQFKDTFTSKKDKKGILKISNTGFDDESKLFVTVNEDNGQTYVRNKLGSGNVCKNSDNECINRLIIKFATLEFIAFNLDKGDKMDVFPEFSDNGELIHLTYDYHSEQKLLYRKNYKYDFKDDKSFFLKTLENGKNFYSYNLVPFDDGYEIETIYKNESYGKKIISNVSPIEAVKWIMGSHLFKKKEGLEPEMIYPKEKYNSTYLNEFEDTDSGKKMTIKKLKNPPSEVVKLDTSLPIPWIQQDATPLDSEGKPLEYLCRVDSPNIFGSYFVFFNAKENQIVQIFQCS